MMVKVPQAGRVKTRLGAEIGMVRAAWWTRHRINALLRATDDPRWQTVLAVAPDTATTSRALPSKARVSQGPGDLGRKMIHVLNSLRPGPVLVVGTDIPGITAAEVAHGFRALRNHDAVFGPTQDGGYWGFGMKHTGGIPADLLKGVRWSSEHALHDSLSCLRDRKTALLGRLSDIDTLSDLIRISR